MPDFLAYRSTVDGTDVSRDTPSALFGVKLPIYINGTNVSAVTPDFYGNDFPKIHVYVNTSEVQT